jgi:deoxyribodipyrimidine photo-lyase
MQPLVIYWSRRDFRLGDNRALSDAIAESVESGAPLVPLFIAEDYMLRGAPESQFGLPSRIFLGKAIPAFAVQFPFFLLAYGVAPRVLADIARSYAISIHVNEDVYPDFYAQVKQLRDAGVRVKMYADQLTIEKDTKTGAGARYSVFTPFKNAVWQQFVTTPVVGDARPEDAAPVPLELQRTLIERYSKAGNNSTALAGFFSRERNIEIGSRTIDLSSLTPEPVLDAWYVSEREALATFDAFLSAGRMDTYKSARDMLGDESGTSRMSLALTWGLVSARQLGARIQKHYDASFELPPTSGARQNAVHYISELIWREFYKYLFFHNPALMHAEFQQKFRGTIEWVDDVEALRRFTAWIRAETGYPLLDAAMRQIAQTGYMHNRARMVAASVLTKNLGVDWRWGQEYFRASLVDLDESSNNGGWQWGASVGADPKPIRIFNPELQAKNYDPEGAYQRRWLPESYRASPPEPIVPHAQARTQALARYRIGHAKPRDY